jgi:hypothetical protein
MKVYIANFGRENYEWPRCLASSTLATMNAEAVHDYWLKGDRESYVRYCIERIKTASGIAPTRPVASRWFNLMTIVAESVGDVWIHREKEQLWWTVSKEEATTITLEDDQKPLQGAARVYICHKPCEPWLNTNKRGNRLEWNSLHAKAKEFLFTEGTLQQLAPDNAAYALALIEGDDLARWHDQAAWRIKAQAARTRPVTIFNARQRAVARMAMTVRDTVASANGQQVLRMVKNKELRFSQQELERYIGALIEAQEGLCAITHLQLQFDSEHDDTELLCSLDRIDSGGHYEAGNLQIVCRFVNRWKNDGNDSEFRRLMALVQSSSGEA